MKRYTFLLDGTRVEVPHRLHWRAECPECGRDVGFTASGKLSTHSPTGTYPKVMGHTYQHLKCEGSSKRPLRFHPMHLYP